MFRNISADSSWWNCTMKLSLPGFLPRVSNDTHGEKIYLERKGKWNNPREKKFLERKEWKCNFCNLRKVRNLLFFNGINHRFLSMDRNAISCPRSIYVHRYFFFNIQIFLPVRIIYIFKYETRNWINKNWISGYEQLLSRWTKISSISSRVWMYTYRESGLY